MIKKIIMIISLLSNCVYCMDSKIQDNQRQIVCTRNISFSGWPFLIRSLSNYLEIPQARMIAKFSKLTIPAIKAYRDLNIEVLFLIKRHDILAEEQIKRISSLIDRGADPHYTYASETTPLIQAVMVNNPELVKYFSELPLNQIISGNQNLHPREYNLIYNIGRLKSLLAPIVDYMLKLETHNATNPNNLQKCEEKIFFDLHAQEFFKALSIDALLKGKGFPVLFSNCTAEPICQLLQGKNKKRYVRLFKYLYNKFDSTIRSYSSALEHLKPRVIDFLN